MFDEGQRFGVGGGLRAVERMPGFAECDDGVGLAAEIVAEGFHFGDGALVVGAVGGRDAVVEAVEGFVGAAEFGEGLGGHLVGGDVVGTVLDEGGELGQGCVGTALADVLHGEAVAREGVRGVGTEDFGEAGDLGVGVHGLMVQFGGWAWQVLVLPEMVHPDSFRPVAGQQAAL
jgi:hypothetical protein